MENYEVVYAADDAFASVMGVSIISLFENNRDLDNLRITIFDSGISEDNKKRIEKIFRKYQQRLPRWIKSDIKEKLKVKMQTDRGSLAQYSRLYIQEYFDSSVNRVLYLDCDTLIVGSLRKIFSMDLKSYIIAGVKDAFSKYYRRNIDLDVNDLMINSGVYIVDMKKWRLNNIENKITNYLVSHNGKVQQGDQGVLNAVLKNNILILPPQYNLMSIFYEYSYSDLIKYREPVNFYSKDEIYRAKKSPIVIHYTSAFNTIRPWFKKSTHPQASKWLKYYSMSPWKNVPLKNSDKSGIKKLLFDIYCTLPNKLALRIASIFQVYVRPLKNRLFNS